MSAVEMRSTPELMIIMPVFNEEASVQKVVMEWFQAIDELTNDYIFAAFNDGSTDNTLHVLQHLHLKLGPRFEVFSHENCGHGQTCLQGYRIACERKIPFVFQIDSDGQCDPQYFCRFWRMRHQFDIIYGHRVHRDDGLQRKLASLLLKLTVWIVGGVWCVDANTPYRLMRSSILPTHLKRIPSTFSLVNIALAALLRRVQSARQGRVPIRFRIRYGGEPTVRITKFGAKAIELVKQMRQLR